MHSVRAVPRSKIFGQISFSKRQGLSKTEALAGGASRPTTLSVVNMRMSPHHMMPGDKGSLDGVKLADGTFQRVWVFARPYRRTIALFLTAIFVAADRKSVV